MELSKKAKENCHKNECDPLSQERVRYFMGRHLTACDFSDEQAYHRTHRLFHNRILHGWGVVCGLIVSQHTRADCRGKYVEVSPGVALDCCGREITIDCNASCGEQGLPEIPWNEYSESRPLLLLSLCYLERKIDQVPVLHHEGDCSETKTDYGRFRESWKLSWRWISRAELSKYGWKNQYGLCPPEDQSDAHGEAYPPDSKVLAQQSANPVYTDDDASPEPAPPPAYHEGRHPHVVSGAPCPEDDCGDPCSEGYKSCLDTRCPPGHCVPLAVICARRGYPVTADQIFMKGRPELPYGQQRLTHIAEINWPHGGVISPSWLKEREGKLRIKFDRKLEMPGIRDPRYPGPSGVNQATFIVQYGEQYEDLDFAIYRRPPRLLDNRCEAVYQLAPQRHHHDEFRHLIGHILWITLKCDFLYDCHGVRVDGNNDGVAGGAFESWVSVIADDDYAQTMKEVINDSDAY